MIWTTKKMPSRKAHETINKLLLGNKYVKVNEWIDEPVKWLGPHHRVLRHSPLDLLVQFGWSPELFAGLVHLGSDYSVSAYKKALRARLGKEGYEQWLKLQKMGEMLAKLMS